MEIKNNKIFMYVAFALVVLGVFFYLYGRGTDGIQNHERTANELGNTIGNSIQQQQNSIEGIGRVSDGIGTVSGDVGTESDALKGDSIKARTLAERITKCETIIRSNQNELERGEQIIRAVRAGSQGERAAAENPAR